MNRISKIALAAALSSAALIPTGSQAASSFVNGAGNASVNLDFRITIPRVLFLRVGTGTAALPFPANNATIDLIDFVVPAANIGDGTAIAATAASGNLGNGSVTAQVVGNNGDVTLTATTTAALTNATGDTINHSILTRASTNANLPVPAFVAAGAGTGAGTVLTAAAKVVNQSANWTFTYPNAAVVPPGTYGSNTGANGGRVTYTAAMP